ncbi:MAG TPA: VOC family protein [Trebonia sp.]|jgi:predicted enzyme related to lactoylglutathione lyase
MSDPLEALRRPLVPLAPDRAFAARLRERIRLALAEGGTMTSETETASPRISAEGDAVYLSLQVGDTARARRFYGAALGWEFGPFEEDGHSLQVQGQSLPLGVWDGPPPRGVNRPDVHIVYRVTDIATAVAAVRSLGGTADEPRSAPYGVVAGCADDQGNGFTLHEQPPDAPRPSAGGTRPGDVVYITISPGDEVRASRFYGDLFGWEFQQGRVPHGLQITGPQPMMGMWGGTGRQVITLNYIVADIEAAVRRVRDAGGTATDPTRESYGLSAECTDDQGITFGLSQL